jgi:DNA-binding transcriptional MerR regulator
MAAVITTHMPDLFPIRVLAERTGVGASTLRAWERRYGLLKPQRTPKGHRLYTEADARLVLQVKELLDDGHSIGRVARQVKERGASLPPSTGVVLSEAHQPRPWGDYLSRLMRAVEAFSARRLDAVYNDASSLYPLDLVSERLIEPALEHLGRRWPESAVGVAEEHFFSAWLRNKLGARLHHAGFGANDGAVLVLACVPGHRHELGLLLFALAALGRGYRVVYLGTDMPFEPLPTVVARCGAKGVVLAAGHGASPESTLAGLRTAVLSIEVPVFVGGPFAVNRQVALDAVGAIPIGERHAPALHRVASKVPVRPAA